MKITERTYQWANPLTLRRGGPRGIVWHHAAATNASAATIHDWHRNQGWSGIGYHFVVRKDGMIERGRPENVLGSHTVGANDRIGVCIEGNLVSQAVTPAQRESIIWLNAYLLSKYGNIPVTRHRDHASTACPGHNFPWPIPKPTPKPGGVLDVRIDCVWVVVSASDANLKTAEDIADKRGMWAKRLTPGEVWIHARQGEKADALYRELLSYAAFRGNITLSPTYAGSFNDIRQH